MFRAANQRGNQILEAAVTVTLARQMMTKEGVVMRRFDELTLAAFALAAVLAVVDGDAPDRQGQPASTAPRANPCSTFRPRSSSC